MKSFKFAAIDIGTNAVRLLFSNVTENKKSATFKKASLIRVPLRLGHDVFNEGKIGEVRREKLISTMHAFHHLINVHDAIDFRACATSAMREAENGREIVEIIRKRTGINIEIIDGKTEAEIIYSNRIVDLIDSSKPYLYVDLGGGSTEITLFSNDRAEMAYSFNIGTIRILRNKVEDSEYDKLKDFLKEIRTQYPSVEIIGSGGNINKIFKLAGGKSMQPMKLKTIREVYNKLLAYSFEDRVKIMGLKPDRADAIIPAAEVFIQIMKWSNAKSILVPKFGVADGLIRQLYYNYKKHHN